MTPAQRALILAALGLTPRDGVMPRWSYRNYYAAPASGPSEWPMMVGCGWAVRSNYVREVGDLRHYHVTRLGAEAAGVLGRCRWEDLP